MSTLIDIIEDEKERLQKLLKYYRNEISQLPRGYISKKKIHGHIYCYRSFRDGHTVKTVYLGAEDSETVKETKEKIQERKKLESLLKRTKENLDEAKRALRAKR